MIKEYKVTLDADLDFGKNKPGLRYNGAAICERWELDGVTHRDEGPAVIYRHPETMQPIVEEYWVNGRRHREPEPAVIAYDEDGNFDFGDWYRHGRRWVEGCDVYNRLIRQHELDGPC